MFARTRWVSELIDAANAGLVHLYWSPRIIAEVSRLKTLLWLQHHPELAPHSKSTRRQLSEDMHRFFAFLVPAFRGIDDGPPDEQTWAEKPVDQWDIPIWNAAVRCNASCVVTVNLKDGPPADPTLGGLRQYNGILYLHPDQLLRVLDRVQSTHHLAALPELAGATSPAPVNVEDDPFFKLPQENQDFLAQILALLDREAESRGHGQPPSE